MSWQKHGSGTAFYCGHRNGEQVTKTYIGSGMPAHYAAAAMEQNQQMRSQLRIARDRERTRIAEAMALSRMFANEVQACMTEQLATMGIHCPKGRGWRRQRANKK